VRTVPVLMTAAALSAMVVGTASAQTMPVEIEVTPAVGGTLFLGDLPGDLGEIDDAFTVGGRAAVRFADRFGVGATVLYAPTTITSVTGASSDLGVWSYGLDLSYHALEPGSMVRPFLVGGVGAKSYDFEEADTETQLMWNLGGGIDIAVHPRATLRLEARDYMSYFDTGIAGIDDELQHDLALTAGLSFRLGGRR
jgi:hypothetical protein